MKQFIKNARLELYRPSFKIFRHSINMNMPTKKYDTYDAAKKKLDQEQKKCVHSNAIKVTDNYDLNIFVQYEIRAKDINKAAGATILALAKVLGCRVEDLLEYDNSEIEDNEYV